MIFGKWHQYVLSSRREIKNYRPISLVCNFAKVFESIIYEDLYHSIKDFLSPHQHDFIDSKFYFIEHINERVSNVFRTYDFLYRNCRDFTQTQTLCTLFCSLVRARLEYGALVWNPIYSAYWVNLAQLFEILVLPVRQYVSRDGLWPFSFTCKV